MRVCDTHGVGSIYEGPIGILTQAQFTEYWDARRRTTRSTIFQLFRAED